ncbi:MAG: heme ABC exporter ATP-binding protein CcmA [Alphaproteobacteria bacterium]|nr:heme ABC exporter ATP-binding protein CcmA [Alphaproteobacteria bacterium]
MPALHAENLACRRGGRLVFTGLGFGLEQGEALLLTGRNGSGKSSLLRLLALLTPRLRGSLTWTGIEVTEQPDAWRQALAWLGHTDAVKSDLTVRESLSGAQILRKGKPDSLDHALSRFDLTTIADRPGRFLSAGQRRRAALARVMLSGAPIWLLDEPASGLDEPSRAALHFTLREHMKSGGLAVISTHGDIHIPNAHPIDLGDFAPSVDALAEEWA